MDLHIWRYLKHNSYFEICCLIKVQITASIDKHSPELYGLLWNTSPWQLNLSFMFLLPSVYVFIESESRNKISRLKTHQCVRICFPEFDKVLWYMENRKTLQHVLISSKASKSNLLTLMKSISLTLKPTLSSRAVAKRRINLLVTNSNCLEYVS